MTALHPHPQPITAHWAPETTKPQQLLAKSVKRALLTSPAAAHKARSRRRRRQRIATAGSVVQQQNIRG